MSERHGYERELSGDYNGLRRILGLSVAEDAPTPTPADSLDFAGDGNTYDGGNVTADASEGVDYHGGDGSAITDYAGTDAGDGSAEE